MISRQSNILEITDINNILDILAELDPDAWLVLDLDNTVCEPLTTIGSDQWFVKLMEYACKIIPDNKEAIAAVIALYHEVQHHVKMRVVQAAIVDIIKIRQNQGKMVVGLTARGEILKEDTFRQLKEIGIDFKGKIIFCDGKDKGVCFKESLKKSDILPTDMVMADDKGKHLVHVEDVALEFGIKFVGLRYGYLDEKVKNVDMNAADAELIQIKPLLSAEANLICDKLKIAHSLPTYSLFQSQSKAMIQSATIPLELQLYETPFDISTLTVATIAKYCEMIKSLYITTYDRIANLLNMHDSLSFATVIQPLINVDIFSEKLMTMCTFSQHAHPREDIRQASAESAKTLETLKIECEQREDVFSVVQLYAATKYLMEKEYLHSEENRFVSRLMRDYKRNGLFITDNNTRDTVTQLKKRLAMRCIEFDRNLDENNTTLLLTADEIEGIPESYLNKNRISENEYKIPLKNQDMLVILNNAVNRNTRKRFFIAYESRCENENLPVLKEILIIRNTIAQLLGYKSHADYACEIRMIKNSENVKLFLEDMNNRFAKLLESNLNAISEFARDKEKDDSFTLEQYDLRYYMRLREEALCSIDMEKIREYFPLDKVISGTLSIYQKLLGLKFVETANDSLWDENVKYFDVYDHDAFTDTLGDKVGSFYLDLYQRSGKPSQACVHVLQSGCDVSHVSGIQNERRLSVAAMLCNFKKNENLLFANVVTFFHEFGHVMHFICSKAKLSTFHGQKMEVDFIETPSKMLENWCYEAAILQQLSGHYQTDEPLPNEIAEKMKNKLKIHAGYLKKQQLVYGFFDYLMHDLPTEDLARLDLKTSYHNIQTGITGLPIIQEACLPAYFSHLVHGYDVGYYGYMMSETYAADMYDSFFRDDPMSTESGALYRKHILEPGASQDAMELLQQFLGRKPSLDAFLEKCGLQAVAKRKLSYLFIDNTVIKKPKVEEHVEIRFELGK